MTALAFYAMSVVLRVVLEGYFFAVAVRNLLTSVSFTRIPGNRLEEKDAFLLGQSSACQQAKEHQKGQQLFSWGILSLSLVRLCRCDGTEAPDTRIEKGKKFHRGVYGA